MSLQIEYAPTGQAIELTVEPSETIGEIKSKIQDETGIPPKHQTLQLNNKTLKKDNKSLTEYGCTNADRLRLMARLRGGGDDDTFKVVGIVCMFCVPTLVSFILSILLFAAATSKEYQNACCVDDEWATVLQFPNSGYVDEHGSGVRTHLVTMHDGYCTAQVNDTHINHQYVDGYDYHISQGAGCYAECNTESEFQEAYEDNQGKFIGWLIANIVFASIQFIPGIGAGLKTVFDIVFVLVAGEISHSGVVFPATHGDCHMFFEISIEGSLLYTMFVADGIEFIFAVGTALVAYAEDKYS